MSLSVGALWPRIRKPIKLFNDSGDWRGDVAQPR